MRSMLTCGAAALTLGLALPAAAQTPSSPDTSAPPASGAAATTPSAGGASTDAAVTVGQSVKDKTGAEIGQVTAVSPGAEGKTTATIKMGADSFAVETSALMVKDGAAVINATQAEIQGLLKK